MYKLKIFSSFGKSENCKDIWERICETKDMDNYGIDKDIYITNDDDYTHVIILNTAMPEIPSHILKKNVIGLAFEPLPFLNLTDEFIEYAIKNIEKYYIGTKDALPEPFVESYSFMWHMRPYNTIPDKTKMMSLMISNKYEAFGHKYRHLLAKYIILNNLPIDIYGNGCEIYSSEYSQLKGSFEENEPYQDYMFHISIENMQTPHYFSEKITNCLLSGTTPIYLGCLNINNYFPNNVINLTGNIEKDLNILVYILKDPLAFKKNIELNNIKDKVYLLRNLDRIFNEVK
tara:strand:- start:478 stop:1341 length:864 start_codon:yes stop_codon:yes gene_type:complete